MGKYLYKIKVIDKNHIAYGMEGEVFATNYQEGKITHYHALFFGYENCKKFGYTEAFIKRTNLSEVGFSFIFYPEQVEVLIDYSKVN